MLSPPDSIATFLAVLQGENPKAYARYTGSLAEFLTTEAGQDVIDLLERAILMSTPPPNISAEHLREHHGKRLLANEIRRLAYAQLPENQEQNPGKMTRRKR